jgi:hypothetical protein
MNNILVCIAKDEPHIEHWLDWHLVKGFSKVIVFANDWEYHNDSKLVEVIPMPGKVRQLQAYNQVLTSYKFDWALFIDVDEYLCVPVGLEEFLKHRSKQSNIGLPWRMMGSRDSGGYNPVERFRHWDWDENFHIKSLVSGYSRNGFFINPHRTNERTVSPENKIIYNSFSEGSDIAWINHYYYQDQEHWRRKLERGRADTIVEKHQRTTEEWFNGAKYSQFEFNPETLNSTLAI